MRIVEGFCLRELLGETIAVPTGSAAEQLSGLVSLNETGAFLFRLLQAEQTEQSLVDALLDTYDTDRNTAAADVSSFLRIMEENALLIREPVVSEKGAEQ